MRATAPIEVRAETIQAVRNKADLALSDRYLNHSGRVLPTLALAGGLSLVGGPVLGCMGIGMGILWCFQNDATYRRKAQEVRTTKQFTPIAEALRDEQQIKAARVIWQYKGDLAAYAWDQRYKGLVDEGDVVTDAPALPPAQADGSTVPYAPIKLDPDCPHFLLMAGSREGKSNALRCLLEGHQRVNYVTTKATDQVPAHWTGYVIQGSTAEKGEQLQWLVDSWGQKLADHAQNPTMDPEWFVFDEAIQLQTYAKRSVISKLDKDLAGLQIEIATQGAAIGAYCVVLGQTKNAGPLGIDLDILQQNFRMVLPLKAKRRMGISVIEKLGGLKLSDEQKEEILTNPARYLQIWLGLDEDIYFDTLPEYQGTLKPLDICPTEGEGSTADHTKALEFLARYDNDKTQQFAANGNQDAIKAIAYCKLLHELMAAPDNALRLSQLASKSGFVSALYSGGVIENRAKGAWLPLLDEFADKGYVETDGSMVWL